MINSYQRELYPGHGVPDHRVSDFADEADGAGEAGRGVFLTAVANMAKVARRLEGACGHTSTDAATTSATTSAHEELIRKAAFAEGQLVVHQNNSRRNEARADNAYSTALHHGGTFMGLAIYACQRNERFILVRNSRQWPQRRPEAPGLQGACGVQVGRVCTLLLSISP